MSMEERKKEFEQKVEAFRNVYPVEMIKDFCAYWTEHNEGGKKMRFEMEKIFNISRRLGTWKRNTERFSGVAPTATAYTPTKAKTTANEDEWVRRWYSKSKEDAEKPQPTKQGMGDLIRKKLYGK